MRRLMSVLEWLIVAAMLIAGVSMFFVDPISSPDPIISLLGSRGAGLVYACIFFATGAGVAYSKLIKNNKVLKWSFFVVYLVAIFVLVLEFVLIGLSWFLLDEVALGLIAAWAWMKVKMESEYITHEELEELERLAQE